MFLIEHKLDNSYIYYPRCHSYATNDNSCFNIFPKKCKICFVVQCTRNTETGDTYQNKGYLMGNKSLVLIFCIFFVFFK